MHPKTKNSLHIPRNNCEIEGAWMKNTHDTHRIYPINLSASFERHNSDWQKFYYYGPFLSTCFLSLIEIERVCFCQGFCVIECKIGYTCKRELNSIGLSL